MKEETMFKNKLIKEKANASFEMDSSGNLIDNSQYFAKRKKKVRGTNQPNDDNIINTEESEDFSRAGPSAEKYRNKQIEVENAEMFDSSHNKTLSKDDEIINTWFFRVLNELFAPYKGIKDQNELLDIIREQYGKLLQSEELIQLKTQIEIILNLPKNCSKSIIINKIKDLRTANLMTNKEAEIGVKIEDFDHVNKNFEAYEEMKNMFSSIKSSLKLQSTATFTETLRAVKKILSAKQNKAIKQEKQDKKKPKPKINPSHIALRKTKIDLDPGLVNKKKTSPSRDNRSPVISGPSSARNDRSQRVIFSKTNNSILSVGGSRFQPTQQLLCNKRGKKKTSSSTSCKKRSPQAKKIKSIK